MAFTPSIRNEDTMAAFPSCTHRTRPTVALSDNGTKWTESIRANRNPSEAYPETIRSTSEGAKGPPNFVSIHLRTVEEGTKTTPFIVIALTGLCPWAAVAVEKAQRIAPPHITKRKKPGEPHAALAFLLKRAHI
jgi:hypothetical protein